MGSYSGAAGYGWIPLLILSIALAVIGNLLAREKGRRIVLWTILGAIPVINLYCVVFFVGAVNLRLERKIDALLAHDASRAGNASVLP